MRPSCTLRSAALTRWIEGAEDDAGAGAREALALVPGLDDVILAVAASGVTPYTSRGKF
jgi:N-acetylmuramic acid 6-phosphate etherase